MMTSRLDSIVQLITAFIIFIFVLILAYFTTRFAAGFQKGKLSSPNVEIVESFRIGQNKLIQIVKVGDRFYSIVSCKDSVTLLGEITKEELTIPEAGLQSALSFQEILDKAKQFKQKK